MRYWPREDPTVGGEWPAVLAQYGRDSERPLEMPPTELARRVGVSRGTLYSNSKKWGDVAKTLRARKGHDLPSGSKSRNRDLEAEADGRESWPTEDDDQ